ncbi:MAG: ATP-binding protein [Deltaproteobacteria bacterium]|nr:ATP-binding protein [Deltaproteobacteria bacterium]
MERIDRILRGLLDFSRAPQPKTERVDLAAFLGSCVQALKDQRQLDGIETHVKAAELPGIEIDAGRLRQVVFNIAVNAHDAMNGAGRLDIAAEAVTHDDQAILESKLHGGERESRVAFTDLTRRGIAFSSRPSFDAGERLVAVHFRDSGAGLSPDAVARVFEPFFTTKPPGQGTGLGLAICQRIIEDFGGVMRFESRAANGDGPHGTVVSLYVPITPRRARAEDRDDLLASLEAL